jgi:hypothetical protein
MADGVDPVFKITKGPLSTPVINGTFPFAANNLFGTTTVDFALDFVNQSGFTATNLNLNFLVFPADLIISVDNSENPFFTSFSISHNLGGLYTLEFFGIDDTHPGILSQVCNGEGSDGDSDDCFGDGADFIIGINGVPPGALISGTGSLTVPEPSTGLSLILGMAGIALLAFRKLRLV